MPVSTGTDLEEKAPNRPHIQTQVFGLEMIKQQPN